MLYSNVQDACVAVGLNRIMMRGRRTSFLSAPPSYRLTQMALNVHKEAAMGMVAGTSVLCKIETQALCLLPCLCLVIQQVCAHSEKCAH